MSVIRYPLRKAMFPFWHISNPARFPWRETGLCQEYFLQRKLKIDGKQFLTGPRYQGGNINKP
ncbi:hypothetical protein ACSLO7_30620, partial [Klebsiella pneumoniae]